MSASSRSILPAPQGPVDHSSSGGPSHDPPKRGGGSKKRVLIESACSACRKRKSKVSSQHTVRRNYFYPPVTDHFPCCVHSATATGTLNFHPSVTALAVHFFLTQLCRPTCSRCVALTTECIYDAEQGESRWGALKRHASIIETERNQLFEILRFVQLASDAEAMALLQRIRSAVDQHWSSILDYVRERGNSHEQTLVAATVTVGSTAAGSSAQTRLPPISTLFETSDASQRSDPPTRRRGASVGSEGSGNSAASYSSTHSMSDSNAPPS